jgi:hypothetical protein
MTNTSKFILLLTGFFFALTGWSQDTTEFKIGLALASPDELSGIPLAESPFSGDALPTSVDLSDKMPPVGKQRFQDCVAWSVAYAVKSYQEHIETGVSYVQGNTINKKSIFSPTYIYPQINNGRDGGSHFVDALNILSSQGAATMEDCPYNEMDCFTRPTSTQVSAASKYKINYWRRVNIADVTEIKAQLNAGYPVMIGARIDQGMRDNGRNRTSTYVWNHSQGTVLGGHAMVIVGYDDEMAAFKVMNSWGTEWGNSGYFWISYAYSRFVLNEGYVAKDAINGPSPNPSPTPNNPVVVNNPTQNVQLAFSLVNMNHNQFVNGVQGMIMSGNITIPPSLGTNYRVVVRFYYNNGFGGKGMPVGAVSTNFSTTDGSAATGSPIMQIPSNGVNNADWQAYMPYQALNVPRGFVDLWGNYQYRQTNLIAETVLYVDNFAVAFAPDVAFFVRL